MTKRKNPGILCPEKFGLYDDKWFVVYQRPYGSSVLLKKRNAKKD